MAEPAPDWPQSLPLYTVLLTLEPTPVVRVNHAVALADNGQLAAALATLEALREQLTDFQPFRAAHATVLEKADDHPAARSAYGRAIGLATSDSDRLLLAERAARLDSSRGS